MKKTVLFSFIAILACAIFLYGPAMVSAGKQSSINNIYGVPVNPPDCTDGWRITGYFTPVETDYDTAEMTEVDIPRVGKMSFNADFVRVIFDADKGYGEGWGKTRFGWYLGNYNGRWHKSDAPLGADNEPLKPNSIAVDPDLIPADSVVTIPGLPGDFGKTTFVSDDEGVTIHGKHIDVYTGEGKDARRKMNWVTFEDDDRLQRVCFSAPR